jgi:Fe-S-cluster containining protein
MGQAVPLTVVNIETATFECSFGRGCEGICCKNGRPSVGPDEIATIEGQLHRALPLMTPAARKLVEAEGFLSRRTKLGRPMVRVVDSWCVFFNKGCVLHTIGAEDGESYQYKPVQCAMFPLEKDVDTGNWYIRQWDQFNEDWDLFCLNPKNTKKKAAESLAAEIALAETGAADAAFEPTKKKTRRRVNP